MKKIYNVLFLLILTCSGAFASDLIDVNVSDRDIQIGEKIELEISVNTGEIGSQELSIELPGQDNFRIFSRQIENRLQNINGEVISESLYTLDLVPYSAGKYTLGPVIVSGSGILIEDDSIIEIKIGDIISATNIETNIISRASKNAKEMDIKDISIPRVPFYGIIALLSIFFLSFYLLLSLFLKASKKLKKKKEKQKIKQSKPSFEELIGLYFQELESRINDFSSQKFFRKYNKGIRKILKQDGVPKALSATLTELKKEDVFTNHELQSIFKKSYKYEFSLEEKQKATRKKYIEKINIYLQK